MRFFGKTIGLMFVGFLFLVLQAQAVSITFDYQTPTDGSGKTSAIGVNANNIANPGFIIETFDAPGSSATTVTAENGGTITIGAGSAFNTLDPTKLDVTGGLGIRKTTTGYAAAPAGDTTSFAYTPGEGGRLPATVKVETSDFYAYQPGYAVSYLGLYYGSIDTYNSIAFYSGDDLLTTSTGFLADGILTGSEILAAMSGISGNQSGAGSNVYVNLFFDASEIFTAMEFRTTGVAFELDNIVAGLRPVPEPASILLLGVGLMGLAGIARKKMGK